MSRMHTEPDAFFRHMTDVTHKVRLIYFLQKLDDRFLMIDPWFDIQAAQKKLSEYSDY